MAFVQIATSSFPTIENPLSDGGKFTTVPTMTATQVTSAAVCRATSSSTHCGAYWSQAVPAGDTGGTWPADQYSEVTIINVEATGYIIPMVRCDSVANTQYRAFLETGASHAFLYAFVGGTSHLLDTFTISSISAADVFRLAVVGNVLTLSQNGSSIRTFTDTNNYVTAGAPGFDLFAPSTAFDSISAFAAGATQAATPTFSPNGGVFTGAQTITITSSSGGTIYYTTDETTPTRSSSSIASGATISVTPSVTVKAIASATNMVDSAVGQAIFIAPIVLQTKSLLASDNFVSGSLDPAWTAITGVSVCQVTGTPKVTEANTLSVTAGQYWSGTFPNDQVCELTATLTNEAGSALGLRARQQTGSNSGYLAFLNNGTATLYRVDSGSTTSLKAVSGLTFAAGDVWAFAVMGSCLFLYQNFKPVLFAPDATYDFGQPGYTQFSSVDLTHCKVSQFRGYCRFAQDGIWQKQTILLPPQSGDLVSTGSGVVGAASIIRGAGVLLAGTVYKLWSSGGNIITSACWVIYAESTDGINWVRGPNQLAGYQEPGVIYNAGTYYLYAQTGAAAASGNIFAFTSTDGVAWGSATDTGIGLGAGGAWDSVFIYNIIPVDVVAGTFRGLYGAGDNATTYLFSLGLCTSSDGIHYTKSVSNPVQIGIQPAAIVKSGSLYYMWATIAQTGQSTSQADVNPAESVMWSTPDLLTWTKVCFSYHHSGLDENVNGVIGQGNISSILDVGGKAYAYTVASPDDSTINLFFQLGLAIAPGTISQIVTLPRQDGTVQIASDAFTSGAGDLSANWTTPTGLTKLKLVAGPYCEPIALDTHCRMYYSGATFSTNHYSECTIRTLTRVGDYIFPIVRQQPAADTYYGAVVTGAIGTFQAATQLYIFKQVAGTPTQIGPKAGFTPQVADVVRMSVIDDPDTGVPLISFFQNNALILQVRDYGTKITGGAPGMDQYSASASSGALADSQISLWAGGNAGVLSAFPAGNAGALRLRRRKRIYAV